MNQNIQSLRQEIAYIMTLARSPLDQHDYGYWVDEILQLFEKRIDSRIQDYTQNPFAESGEVISELEDIKKELLK